MGQQIIILPKGVTEKDITVDAQYNEIPSNRRVEIELHEGRVGEISDGYHTFNELYEHRMALTLALCATLSSEFSWRSKQHHPRNDEMFDGFFIVGIDLPNAGTVTYHYKLEHWDKFKGVDEIEHAPAWDGHTPQEALDRLMKYGGAK